ncbi:TraX family protein [Stenotrophomonas rhizophila]|uniref:TraX family protein n=1 Tax=Stenotrophomonas rhizophila TaxID=216778 RepID=UPI00081CA699|nr:TraX family protein [Stenotrophomonas rhizophila]AOA72393.1 conjugal transfer protein TrbP [Stenotrophomonas rhizophila]
MTSGAREALKWLAVVFMTLDHAGKIIYSGEVPGLSEVGRLAFPLFAGVMAYNLAQPGADVAKSIRRLVVWGVIAQPVHAFAFGYWLPLNILLTFALSATVIYALSSRYWLTAAFAAGAMPVFVDYQWAGVAFVVLSWAAFRHRHPWLLVPAFAAICLFNGNLWALAAVPVAAVVIPCATRVPRTRWAFYGYYVGHLALLATVVSTAG